MKVSFICRLHFDYIFSGFIKLSMIVNKKIIAAASIPVIVLIVMAYNDPRFREHCRYCECENNQSGTLQSSSMFRPRGALARAVYSKQVVDSQLARMDHSKVGGLQFML